MTLDRKAAIREFKERKTARGTFAVRCLATAEVWVGSARNLDAVKNRIWFGLRLGNHSEKSLQERWNLHGEQAFEYEVLEKLDDDVSPLAEADALKEKKGQWMEKLAALGLLAY
jgi:hypothetical protein